ncbi:MAG: hypothetical protein NG784_14080 [Candidatus Jettenia sp.]|nr:hypothetical protein [Candidatus Jettenia sp.]
MRSLIANASMINPDQTQPDAFCEFLSKPIPLLKDIKAVNRFIPPAGLAGRQGGINECWGWCSDEEAVCFQRVYIQSMLGNFTGCFPRDRYSHSLSC